MTTNTQTLPVTLNGVNDELADLGGKVEALSERVGSLIVEVERKGEAKAKADLADAYAELEGLRDRRRRLQELQDEMRTRQNAIERAKRQAEDENRWKELDELIGPLGSKADAVTQGIVEDGEKLFKRLLEARDVNREIALFHTERASLRRTVAPHSEGRPVPDIDIVHLDVLGVELMPALRIISRDLFQSRIFDQIEAAVSGKR